MLRYLTLLKMNEQPKLKAHQKRAMFKARFGPLLNAQGFQYHRNRFIRFHEGQVLLCVRMELSRTGEMDICFGGMPLCVKGIDPLLSFGERILSFAKIHPMKENPHLLSFEEQLNAQAELFENYLLDSFAEIDGIASLLDYQERILEDRLSMMPADWATWECVYLRDYEKARRYASLWEVLAEEDFERYLRETKDAVLAEDLNRRDREIRLRDQKYLCKCRRHSVYAAQRLAHLLDLGAYPLLQENIARNIEAANAAVLEYMSKE